MWTLACGPFIVTLRTLRVGPLPLSAIGTPKRSEDDGCLEAAKGAVKIQSHRMRYRESLGRDSSLSNYLKECNAMGEISVVLA